MYLQDRVKDTTTSTGTGNLTLAGTTFPDGVVVPYTFQTADTLVWEAGIGKRVGSAFQRLVVLSNSNNDKSAITVPSGTKTIWIGTPSEAVLNQWNHLTLSETPKTNNPGNLYWGTGVLGDVTIASGTTTLTAPAFYRNLTIALGATLVTNGHILTVSEVLKVAGTIAANGGDGGNGSGGVGGAAGTVEATGEFTGGSNSSAGTAGASNLSTSNNGPAAAVPSSVARGGGGDGGSGGIGGAGSVGASTAGASGGGVVLDFRPPALAAMLGLLAGGGAGGAGGSAGSSSVAAIGTGGGGGGGGGGRLVIIAQTIIVTGSIEANGGNGGDGANA